MILNYLLYINTFKIVSENNININLKCILKNEIKKSKNASFKGKLYYN
ncbi:hypothetical protein FDC45_20240 [Clostridium botulinum]|uniref:Uncharacterized protein n=1 Tax=Clostridium botulinum TaxID=1491 RepID=A0A846JA02_CLOBO|nr:hypothetical protein CLK_0685 [Clostridium botulinum A3 str. Loch Maree]NFH66607.1 hypothetical protein [Clostridium botulinum]NFJ10362.1 hypothetical protein [Clostridium botulinum]NFK15736.1 hypothetical protein [Clostridium botulinum]NFM95737.1 hypothetical protein [Clostridium botulinum]